MQTIISTNQLPAQDDCDHELQTNLSRGKTSKRKGSCNNIITSKNVARGIIWVSVKKRGIEATTGPENSYSRPVFLTAKNCMYVREPAASRQAQPTDCLSSLTQLNHSLVEKSFNCTAKSQPRAPTSQNSPREAEIRDWIDYYGCRVYWSQLLIYFVKYCSAGIRTNPESRVWGFGLAVVVSMHDLLHDCVPSERGTLPGDCDLSSIGSVRTRSDADAVHESLECPRPQGVAPPLSWSWRGRGCGPRGDGSPRRRTKQMLIDEDACIRK